MRPRRCAIRTMRGILWEPPAGFRQHARDHRMVAVGLLADMVGDQPDDRLGRISGDGLGQRRAAGGDAVDSDPPVGIDHHLDHAAIAGPSARRSAWNSRSATIAFFTGIRRTPVRAARCCAGHDAIRSHLT